MENLKKLSKSELINIINSIYITADNAVDNAEKSAIEMKDQLSNPYAFKYGYLEGTLRSIKQFISEQNQ
jgi:hypothetical protein